MEWEVDDKNIPGSYTKAYMARITGEDPTYRLHRKFLWWDYEHFPESSYTRRYWELSDGVYEYRLRRYSYDDDTLLEDNRVWFVLLDDEVYEIDYDEVLFALFNYKLQKKSRVSAKLKSSSMRPSA